MRSRSGEDSSPSIPTNSANQDTEEQLTAIIRNMRDISRNSGDSNSRSRAPCLQEENNSELQQNLSDRTATMERRSISSSEQTSTYTSAFFGLGSRRIANSSEGRVGSFRDGILDGSETAAAFFGNLPQQIHNDYRIHSSGRLGENNIHFNSDRFERHLPDQDRLETNYFHNNHIRDNANHTVPPPQLSESIDEAAPIRPIFTGKVNSWKDRIAPFLDNNHLFVECHDSCGYILELILTTWSRDSHDLFDYEAPADKISAEKISIFIARINTNHTQLLCRIRYEFLSQNGQPTISTRVVAIDTMEGPLTSLIKAHLPRGVRKIQAEVLMQIDIKPVKIGSDTYYNASLKECDPCFLVQQPEIVVTAKQKLFQIIRDTDFQQQTDLPQITLKEDLVVKLGRYPVKIKQLVASGDRPVPIQLTLLEADKAAIARAKALLPSESVGIQCRICLCEGADIGDPLLSACACRGSIQYIHATCLQYWFKNSQVSAQSANEDPANTQCHVTATNCELCKQQFPPFIDIPTADHANSQLERFDLISTTPLMPPFVVFESLQHGNARIYANSLLKNSENGVSGSLPVLKVGRGHESTMRIPDVSISRTHAEITLDEDDSFTLKDLQSKFGTLVQAEKPILLFCLPDDSTHLDPDESSMNGINAFTRTSLQCGRTVVDCVLRSMTPREKYEAGLTQGAFLDAFALKHHLLESDSMALQADLLEIETNESESRSHSSFT